MGAMMNIVRINARPYSAMFGGICWMPRALRSSENTTASFRNDVPRISNNGSIETADSRRIRCSGWSSKFIDSLRGLFFHYRARPAQRPSGAHLRFSARSAKTIDAHGQPSIDLQQQAMGKGFAGDLERDAVVDAGRPLQYIAHLQMGQLMQGYVERAQLSDNRYQQVAAQWRVGGSGPRGDVQPVVEVVHDGLQGKSRNVGGRKGGQRARQE